MKRGKAEKIKQKTVPKFSSLTRRFRRGVFCCPAANQPLRLHRFDEVSSCYLAAHLSTTFRSLPSYFSHCTTNVSRETTHATCIPHYCIVSRETKKDPQVDCSTRRPLYNRGTATFYHKSKRSCSAFCRSLRFSFGIMTVYRIYESFSTLSVRASRPLRLMVSTAFVSVLT